MGAVADRRAAAAAAGMSLKDYKAMQASGGSPSSSNSGGNKPKPSNQETKPLRQQNVSSASDYNYSAHRQNTINSGEIAALRKQGFSQDEIRASMAASGLQMGKKAQQKLDRWDARAAARQKAVQVKPVQEPVTHTAGPKPTPKPVVTQNPGVTPGVSQPAPTTPAPNIEPPSFDIGGGFTPPPSPGFSPGVGGGYQPPSIPGFDGSFSVGGDLDQNIGKVGDMTTTIGDNNTIGPGSSIGNDYSVTIGNNHAGNINNGSGGYGGGPFGGNSNPLSSMQQAAAYGALNTNAWAKSQSMLNGYGRSQGAIQQAAATTGATDRVANLYNFAGQSQNYWNNKATAQQGFYLGDMFNFRAPDWTMPEAPEKPEDKTEEIANSLNFDDDED